MLRTRGENRDPAQQQKKPLTKETRLENAPVVATVARLSRSTKAPYQSCFDAQSIPPDVRFAGKTCVDGSSVSKTLPVPPNITLVPLPSKSPELNPVENIWQFMRDNWLSNSVFKSYEDILDHCCVAWNKLIDMPWKIMSIGTRDWAYRS